jgi:hypothetical protein
MKSGKFYDENWRKAPNYTSVITLTPSLKYVCNWWNQGDQIVRIEIRPLGECLL